MDEIRVLSSQAADDFEVIDVSKFYRAYINEYPKCDVVDNIYGCFNNYILLARSKPTIDFLEDIMIVVMRRMTEKRDLFVGYTDILCYTISKIVEENKRGARFCEPIHGGDHKFQIRRLRQTQAEIDQGQQTSATTSTEAREPSSSGSARKKLQRFGQFGQGPGSARRLPAIPAGPERPNRGYPRFSPKIGRNPNEKGKESKLIGGNDNSARPKPSQAQLSQSDRAYFRAVPPSGGPVQSDPARFIR
ncbi:hypothetical protein CRG98_011661 [Punica granatum]|uniref:Uncharacterized protein n=1 Tax=Punica granatum TaxID=22663 RepID=A0A2I0KHS0_PUNGR|nr:hypothetical protein CRG98_011661 [Punica granatum]